MLHVSISCDTWPSVLIVLSCRLKAALIIGAHDLNNREVPSFEFSFHQFVLKFTLDPVTIATWQPKLHENEFTLVPYVIIKLKSHVFSEKYSYVHDLIIYEYTCHVQQIVVVGCLSCLFSKLHNTNHMTAV